jgi:1,2-diacylglycerol 3-alpha-glucosyltransferase
VRIAVLFDNFGPYHIARLSAAARECEILGLEVAGRSTDYDWMPTNGSTGFLRSILLEQETSAGAKTRILRARLHEVLSTFRAEVVAIPGWSSRAAFCALEWCLEHGVPAIVMSESQAIDGRRSGTMYSWSSERVKQSLLRAFGAGLVGGESHRQYLVQLGMPAEQVFLGYDAIDNDYFARGAAATRANAAEIRQKLSLPQQYFLASNRFIPKKNLPFLIRSYARYRRQSPISRSNQTGPWDLVILGDGPLRAEIEKLIAECGLAGHVSLPGFRQYEDLPAYYGLAGGFVHASTTEQWGLVVNEAMAAGLPVLVSNRCGCAAELVKQGKNGNSGYSTGWQFAPDDEAALADLMACLAGDEPSRVAMGRQSVELISSWGPDRFARGLRDAAQCALSTGGVPDCGTRRHWLDGLILRLCKLLSK